MKPPGSAYAALASTLLILLVGCDGGDQERALSRLERLALVPAGSCVLFAGTSNAVDCSTDRPLLVDRFEVTRAEWEEWLDGVPEDHAAWSSLELWPGEPARSEPTYPATGMALAEARAFAGDQGMRLPTAREWIRVAAGSRAQYWPWGSPRRSVSNTLELGLLRPAPVGTFEGGRTSRGVYDLVGNAAEWVPDGIFGAEPPYWEFGRGLLNTLRYLAAWGAGLVEPQGLPPGEDRVWVMGGGFLSHKRETYGFDFQTDQVVYNARLVDPGDRSSEVGFRLVADAEEWLPIDASSWGDDEAARERLRAVGRSWGRRAVPLLRRLVERGDASPALAFLLAGAEE